MTFDRRASAVTDAVIREELLRRLSRIAPGGSHQFSEDMALADIGIGSLDLLELIDALETRLGVNPFEERLALSDVRSIGDLYAAYRPAPEGSELHPASDDLLESGRRRAAARRRGRQP